MGCASGCVKCCLNTINTLWAIGSIGILAFAALFASTGPTILIALLFVIGGIGLIAAILGCCGICQEHICMTTAYAGFLVVSLILQIGGMIFANNYDGIRKYADEDMTKLWNEEVIKPGAMDVPQEVFKCCGLNSPHDYIALHRDYPHSCYSNRANQTTLHTDGCKERAEKVYVDLVSNVLSGTWGNIVFTIIMLVFAIYLIMRFRRKQRHYNY